MRRHHHWQCSYCHNIVPAFPQYSLNVPSFLKCGVLNFNRFMPRFALIKYEWLWLQLLVVSVVSYYHYFLLHSLAAAWHHSLIMQAPFTWRVDKEPRVHGSVSLHWEHNIKRFSIGWLRWTESTNPSSKHFSAFVLLEACNWDRFANPVQLVHSIAIGHISYFVKWDEQQLILTNFRLATISRHSYRYNWYKVF